MHSEEQGSGVLPEEWYRYFHLHRNGQLQPPSYPCHVALEENEKRQQEGKRKQDNVSGLDERENRCEKFAKAYSAPRIRARKEKVDGLN